MTKTLMITSDFKMSLGMKWLLTYMGFNNTVAGSLDSARRLIEQVDFKIIMLDTKLAPDTSAEFIRSLRKRGLYTPVIYICATPQEARLKESCTGLDQVLTYPFAVTKIKSVLGLALKKAHSTHKPLVYGEIILDEPNRTLVVRGERVPLGRVEMKILLLLCTKAGKVVGLERIQSIIENEGVRFSTRVFHHVSCLRQKLESAGIRSLQINFVKDGYRVDLA